MRKFEWFTCLHLICQALVAGFVTWFVTATGAACVFFARRIHRRLLDVMPGFAGGVIVMLVDD
jgi:ZIP family zinc transporter